MDQKIGEAELLFLETWVQENPGSRQFVRLAWAYGMDGRFEDAAAVLTRGLVIDPDFLDARALLAEVLEELGDSQGAMEQLDLVADILAGHHESLENLARLRQARDDDEGAEAARAAAEALVRAAGRSGGTQAEPVFEEADPWADEPVPRQVNPQKLVGRLQALAGAARRRTR